MKTNNRTAERNDIHVIRICGRQVTFFHYDIAPIIFENVTDKSIERLRVQLYNRHAQMSYMTAYGVEFAV